MFCAADESVVEARGKDYLYATSDQEFSFVRCTRCGHLYLNPRPTLAAINRIYPPEYSSFSGKFARDNSVIAWIKERVILRRFGTLGRLLPPRFCLMDIGCGDGRFLLSLRRLFPDSELYALDWKYSPSVLEELRRANIHAITGTVETAPLPPGKFDAIVMNQLIEHVWDPRVVIDRCRAALKVGGRLAMETPNPEGYDRRLFKAGAWGSYYWPRHLNLFSRAHLSRLVEEAGMSVELWQPLLAPPCWTYSIRSLFKRLGLLGKAADKIFADTNSLVLAPFAAIDLAATLLGMRTSNQKLIAVRPPD